jgi:diguanylate cyclase (GGDEF)-like protein/PAS domain S-box-containing protein
MPVFLCRIAGERDATSDRLMFDPTRPVPPTPPSDPAVASEVVAGHDPLVADYRQLVQNANTIVLRWDLEGHVVFLNDFGLALFGYTLEQLRGRSVIGTIVPETETSGRDLRAMIAQLLAQPDQYVHNENENIRQDGGRLWITWRNCVLRDAGGAARELLSFGMDTTERKRAEDALRDSERRYRVLFESTPIALVERDATALQAHLQALHAGGVGDVEAYLRADAQALAACMLLVPVTDINAAAVELFETDAPAALDRFAHIEDPLRLAELASGIIVSLDQGRIASEERQTTLLTFRGRRRHVLVRSTVLPGSATMRARIVTAFIDVTEQVEATAALRASEERFRFLAVHDNLTGLYNTRHLYEQLPALLRPGGPPCSVVFVDLDRFKHVVDTHGHLNGSRVIQEVAQVIETCIAEPQFAVAYAGDEFVVVLPGGGKVDALAVADRIRAQIGARTFLASGGLEVQLGASFGVATYPDDAADLDDLLALADDALFTAKRRGRNTIVAAGDPQT